MIFCCDFLLIDIVVYDGLDEMDALAPLEVSAAPVKPALMSRRPHRVVLGDYGLRFLADSVRGRRGFRHTSAAFQ